MAGIVLSKVQFRPTVPTLSPKDEKRLASAPPPNHFVGLNLADTAGHRLRAPAARTMPSSIGSVRGLSHPRFMLTRAELMTSSPPYLGLWQT